MTRKKVAILGSTGSIGTQALDVIERHPDRFEVVGLAAGRNLKGLREQADRFQPKVATSSGDGPNGLTLVATESGADILLAATDGMVALDAVFAAVDRGIDVAVANKELVVAAGELLMQHARKGGSKILPVDSEHSAIFQCLLGEDRSSARTIVLTASGGPFWRKTKDEIEHATIAEALAHPTWRMGPKNTIDSATLMNKGLEVIEASHFFGMAGDHIAIVVHPQSIAHGAVIFSDGSVKLQACAPDMRVPIGFALAYPDRLDGAESEPSDTLAALGAKSQGRALRYDFEPPDLQRFPCVALAYAALARGGTAPAVLSAANEVAVSAFLEGRLRFSQIPAVVEQAMQAVPNADLSLDTVREADRAAREVAIKMTTEGAARTR
jgi:1-deoxy-D-xylulose-5-phosphate reductoisomerase